jgi:uncharacterized membrane protein YkoI
MKKYLFLILAAAMFVGCDNDDAIFPSNQRVVESLLTKYPSAQNITWGRAWGYWVAEFERAEQEVMVECEAWISNNGLWYLGVSDIPYPTLPAAVQEAFNASKYSEWFIDEVDMVERYNSQTVYIIEAEVDESNTGNVVDLYYTPDGTLLRTIENGAEPYYRPIILSDSVTNYLAENYPAGTIVDIATDADVTEVDIMDGTTLRKIYFDGKSNWLMTASRITENELPEVVIETIATSQYATWDVVQVELIENPDGEYYQITLAGEENQVVMKIDADGRILQ